MGHWIISSALEPVYVDDPWDNPNYDPRTDDMDCMMCPCSLEECDKREVCYWDEVWREEREESAPRSTDNEDCDLSKVIGDIIACFTLRDRRK